MNYIKTHWKEILISLLLIFGLNKCTQSCSRGTLVNKQNNEIVKKDSIIKKLKNDSILMATRFADAQGSMDAYIGIATGNQQDMINEISKLKIENDNLNVKNKKLINENKKLRQQISILKSN